LNVSDLDKKVSDLSEKIDVEEPSEKIARFDLSCFSKEEQLLFEKVSELRNQGVDGFPMDVYLANRDLILKVEEIFMRYSAETFKYILWAFLGYGDDIEKWYINLHFQNFIYDLTECIRNLKKWSPKEREDYLAFLKKENLMGKAFRCPRGPSVDELKTTKGKA
jgi:hypothetical protein